MAAVEKHLPGDFSRWEAENSSWEGEVKIVDGTKPSPQTEACAWRLFVAYQRGEQMFGFADQKKDREALEQLAIALDQAEDALSRLSDFTRLTLSNASFEAVSGVVKVPADMLFQPVADGLRQGILESSRYSDEHGTPPSRQDRMAAAVVGECRTTFQVRTGKKAPKSVRDSTYPKAPFVLFAQDVFDVFGIGSRVDSALRTLRNISN